MIRHGKLVIVKSHPLVPSWKQLASPAAVAFALSFFQSGCSLQEPAVSGPAPKWELRDVEGQTVKSSDFAGKVVILNFWATWCGPCRLEIPEFVELQNEYGGNGLVVIGASLDEQGPPVVKKFMTNFDVNYPVVMANDRIVADYGGVHAIPTTFVIDRQGNLAAKRVGYTSKSVLEKTIKGLL